MIICLKEYLHDTYLIHVALSQVVDTISSRLGRSDNAAREALMSALCNVLSKPFRPATYFVAGSLPSIDHYRYLI